MQIVFLVGNGIGLGHLVRLSRIARAVHDLGGRPIFFCQAPPSASSRQSFPTTFVTPLVDAPPEARSALATDLRSFLETGGGPCVLVEDTHPSGLVLPPSIPRALIVRPVDWQYLNQLQADYRHTFQAFFLADSPMSPTWPYSDEETAAIKSWRGWDIVGPVYRRPSRADVERLQHRIGLDPETPLCVFTMGGGGQHPETSDVEAFATRATSIGASIRARDPRARLLFVRGPLFPKTVTLPPIFETLDEEPDMHALLAAARCAVLRPGFNTTWECLAAGTVMHPVIGTSYVEPIDARMERLRSHGFLPEDPIEAWSNGPWRALYGARCESLNKEWGGADYRIAERLITLATPSRQRTPQSPTSRRVLIMTINGVGIGHVVRSARLVRALVDGGHKCLMLFESNDSKAPHDEELTLDMFPCRAVRVPRTTNRKHPNPEVLSKIESLLHEFDPDVVVTDCHVPMAAAAASLGGLRARYRLAIHSAPSIDILRQLGTRVDADYSMLLHDHSEFEALYGHAVPIASLAPSIGLAGGPIGRGPSLRTEALSRPLPANRFVLIVLGGGGEHPDRQDMRVVSGMLGDIADHAWRTHGWETVCATGPLFREAIRPGHPAITTYSYIHNLEAFIDAAEIIIARPGFNLAREIVGRNRVVFLKTYQFQEALTEQISHYTRVPDVRYAECDANAVIAAIDELVLRREPVAAVPFGDGLRAIVEHVSTVDCEAHALRSLRDLVGSFREPAVVNIRIDDVLSLESATGNCVRELLAMGADLSIEVIPYSHRLTAAALDAIDPDGHIEVGQHGYSHLPRRWRSSSRGEFSLHTNTPQSGEREDVARGRDMLTAAFGWRFVGGFSTPFDALPSWLPAVWEQLGGSYMSYIWRRPAGARLPVVHVGVDPWDWERNRRWSAGEIVRATTVALMRRGEVGFVLHPERLSAADWRMLRQLFIALLEGGAITRPLHRSAALQAGRVVHSTLRDYAATSM